MIDVASGWAHNCAVDTAHTLHQWGTITGSFQKIPETLMHQVDMIAVGMDHGCVLTSLRFGCWGFNDAGQTDLNANINGDLLTSVQSIGCGLSHTCIVHSGHRLVCFGSNEYGQVKLQQSRGLQRPMFMLVVSGTMNNCAVLAGGLLRCWGVNSQKQLDGISGVQPQLGLALGNHHSCVLKEDGVMCQGDNLFGQLEVPSLRK